METNEKMMTGEESLRIITEMINTTKVNFSQSIFHLLLWGWLVFFCSLSEYLLARFTTVNDPWYIWLLTIPGVFISMGYGYSKGRKARVFTYGDKLSMWTWLGYLLAMIVLFILMKNDMKNIAPFILMLSGLPIFISGFIIRFRALIFGGLSLWVLALVSGFAGNDLARLAVPVAMITGYLVPAYLLKRKTRHDAV